MTFLFVLASAFYFSSCAPAYKAYIQSYSLQFNSKTDSIPDYADLSYWAAHPWKKDPSDSIPKPIRGLAVDSTVDVFFIHPTTLTQKELQGKVWNASINDAALNAKTDYSSVLYQASVFNGSCRVFAPRYRQAHLYTFYTADTLTAQQSLQKAYDDVKAAFSYYLQYYNQGRPVIIASHSQGTAHAARLLKEFFEKEPLQRQLVCAYLWGLVLPKNYFAELSPCSDSSSTGCFTGWRTFRKKYLPEYVKKENGSSWVTNPLSWRMDEEKIPRRHHKGAVLFNFNKVLPHTNGAQIQKGVVWIERPRFPFSFLSGRKNYHPGDINLFYMDVRRNVQTRIRSYFHQSSE